MLSLSLVALLAAGVPHEVPIQAASAPVGAFGAVVNGLQVTITPLTSGSGVPADIKLEIALQNVGDSDYVLNVGAMVGNGKSMWPDAIRLLLADSAGPPRELRFFSRAAGVAGRIDDYIVALRAGSVYTVRVSLEDYIPDRTAKLTVGRYKIAAQFVGRLANGVNRDMQGVALLNFWGGIAHSNVAEFDVSR